MASRYLLALLLSTCLSIIAYAAAPPVSLTLSQPLEQVNTAPSNASAPKDLALLNETIPFQIPGTQIRLLFSGFSKVISQSELDLCIIEGIASVFDKVLSKGKDDYLPLNSVDYKYGNVVINVDDFSAPAFRMTYSGVVTSLRSIALFTSMRGYYAASFEVYEGKKGHVGTGEYGPIIPG